MRLTRLQRGSEGKIAWIACAEGSFGASQIFVVYVCCLVVVLRGCFVSCAGGGPVELSRSDAFVR